jgi:hypothetical protein
VEHHLTPGERLDHILGAPNVTDDRLRTEMPHLRHARDPADEAYDGVVAPYERRDKRSTERAGRSGYEYSHDDSYTCRWVRGVLEVTGVRVIFDVTFSESELHAPCVEQRIDGKKVSAISSNAGSFELPQKAHNRVKRLGRSARSFQP